MNTKVIESLNTKVVDKIKDLRTNLGLSQEKMAQQLNMSKSCYIRLEKGVHHLTLDETVRIAAIFNTDFHTLTNTGSVYHNSGNKSVVNHGNIIIYNITKEDFDDIKAKEEG
jgi:DNA-binding XRE family transcriptional regulator